MKIFEENIELFIIQNNLKVKIELTPEFLKDITNEMLGLILRRAFEDLERLKI